MYLGPGDGCPAWNLKFDWTPLGPQKVKIVVIQLTGH